MAGQESIGTGVSSGERVEERTAGVLVQRGSEVDVAAVCARVLRELASVVEESVAGALGFDGRGVRHERFGGADVGSGFGRPVDIHGEREQQSGDRRNDGRADVGFLLRCGCECVHGHGQGVSVVDGGAGDGVLGDPRGGSGDLVGDGCGTTERVVAGETSGLVASRGLIGGKGANYDRNKRNRERRRRNKAVDAGLGGVKHGECFDAGRSGYQAREDYAEVHGLSPAELDVDEFAVGTPVSVADVLTKKDMKRLAKQRAQLYELRNRREVLRLEREIQMEEETLASGANKIRVGNWVSEVKAGASKATGMSRGSTSTGRVTKRSAWSAGSWRTREKSDQTGVSSFVTEEEHQKVVAASEAFRLEAEQLKKEIRHLTQNDKFRHDDSLGELGMVPSWDNRK